MSGIIRDLGIDARMIDADLLMNHQSALQIREVLNGEGRIVCGWCFSLHNDKVLKALGLPNFMP